MRALRTLVVLSSVLGGLAGCGDKGVDGGEAGGSGIPWRDGPTAEIREALARVPGLPGGTAEVFDFPSVRKRRKGTPPERQHGVAEWRRFLVSTLGLPDEVLGLGVDVRWKEEGTSWPHMHAAKVPLEAVRAGAARVGHVEKPGASGETVWEYEGGEGDEVARWSNGWVRSKPRERDDRRIPMEAEKPSGPWKPLLEEHPALAAALGGLPADALSLGVVEVAWAKGVSSNAFGPDVHPLSHAEWKQHVPPAAGIVLVFPSEDVRAAARERMMHLFEEAKKRGIPDVRFTIEGHGSLARMIAAAGSTLKQELTKGVERELQTLAGALVEYHGQTGAFPSDGEGLGVLATLPRVLDNLLGVVPTDPWDHPYHYRAPKDGGAKPDLRSRGPDGEIDTEDDLFPPD